MKRFLCFCMAVLLLLPLVPGAAALDITAPEPDGSAASRMPSRNTSFGDGVKQILGDLLPILQPDFYQALRLCGMLIAVALTVCLCRILSGKKLWAASLAGILGISALLLGNSRSCIRLGAETVAELSDYGKLLLPVMTAALSAQGGITSAGMLCAGTAAFDAALTALIKKLMLPSIYLFLTLSTVSAATEDSLLKRCKVLWKSAVSWVLKTLLTCFTAYMGITGAVSGTADKTAVKAAKTAISTAVPVVGSILSDASEAVLVSAALVKNAAGVYGIWAILAIFLEPFFRIGIQYLLLKLTAAVCGVFGAEPICEYIDDFSTAMGLLMGMIGSVCLILLISCICFLKGVGGS